MYILLKQYMTIVIGRNVDKTNKSNLFRISVEQLGRKPVQKICTVNNKNWMLLLSSINTKPHSSK